MSQRWVFWPGGFTSLPLQRTSVSSSFWCFSKKILYEWLAPTLRYLRQGKKLTRGWVTWNEPESSCVRTHPYLISERWVTFSKLWDYSACFLFMKRFEKSLKYWRCTEFGTRRPKQKSYFYHFLGNYWTSVLWSISLCVWEVWFSLVPLINAMVKLPWLASFPWMGPKGGRENLGLRGKIVTDWSFTWDLCLHGAIYCSTRTSTGWQIPLGKGGRSYYSRGSWQRARMYLAGCYHR